MSVTEPDQTLRCNYDRGNTHLDRGIGWRQTDIRELVNILILMVS